MTLKTKFFLVLILVTTLPLLVLLFGVSTAMEKELTARTDAEVHTALDKMSTELSSLLNTQKSIAKGLSRVPAIRAFATSARSSDKKAYQKYADELESFFLNYQHALPSIQALRFIAPNGKTLVKVKEGKLIEPKREDRKNKRYYVADQSNKLFFKRALDAKKSVSVSDFELGQVTPDADFCPAMMRYSVRLKDELDQFDGMLVVNMWGTRFDNTIEAAMGGYPGNIYMVELNQIDSKRDGIYLFHKNRDFRFSNQTEFDYKLSSRVSNTQWQSLTKSESGTLTLEDNKVLFYRNFIPFDSTKKIKWLLAIEVDNDIILAPVNKMRNSIWLLLISVLVVSVVVAVWAAVKLTMPVHMLADMITKYADGDRNVVYKGKSTDEIGIAGRAFNYLIASLEKAKEEKEQAEHIAQQSERLASVGQLAAGIGHEINNPLMNIMSLASLVEKSLGDENIQAKKDLNLLMKEGNRCARIVQGILNFARETKPEYSLFNMTNLLNETIQLIQHRINEKEIRLELNIENDLEMDGDSNLIQQVLVNVLLNAIQASLNNKKIIINAKSNDDYIEISIIDNGIGIKKDEISQVFDPFFTTKDEGEGTGLGLSVSYGIIKHHDGVIRINNNEENGIEVNIVLPKHKIKKDSREQADYPFGDKDDHDNKETLGVVNAR
ncbi:MAG: ATP-binding protein [Gammaproteobacteria bacterium]